MSDAALYIIELEPGEDKRAQWYVGISEDPERRFQQHTEGHGADWVLRNNIVDRYVLGWGERSEVRNYENVVTRLLMAEFGRETTRGGNYRKPELVNYPPPPEKGIPPWLAVALKKVDNEEISALASWGAVYVEIPDRIQFENIDQVVNWADKALPQGVTVEITPPIENTKYTVTAEQEKSIDELPGVERAGFGRYLD